MALELHPFVAGLSRPTTARRPLRAPFDGAELGTVGLCGPAEVEEAIAAAAAAFPVTRRLGAWERAAICARVALALAGLREELALAMCLEGGKPIADARGEVDRAVHCFETAGAEAERLGGELLPLDLRASSAGRFGITRRLPAGPVAAIAPFNFPLNLGAHKLAPAIAAGCPVVLKPASQTPSAALRLAELIDAAGWPRGALSVLPCSPEVAAPLVTDERLAVLSFTGSAEVGWELRRRAGRKRVLLELGGNAAVIVDEGADLDYAVPRIVYGAFSYAGQKCIAVQRIFVHERIAAVFLERLVAATAAASVGDPRDPAVLVGPLIDEASARRVEAWIEEARGRGAERLAGGPRHGNLVPPTILAGVPRDARVCCDEVFGPVATVEPFARFEEALAAANDSPFGLQAGVFTEQLDRALAAFAELEVGGVILNDVPTYRIDPMPYGGVKGSGLGREGIRYAIEELTELRLLVINGQHHAP